MIPYRSQCIVCLLQRGHVACVSPLPLENRISHVHPSGSRHGSKVYLLSLKTARASIQEDPEEHNIQLRTMS